MLKSTLCDYIDAYVLNKETISVTNTAEAGNAVSNNDKKVIFKSCAPYTDCIGRNKQCTSR